LQKLESPFLLHNISFFWLIDARLGVWVADIKKQLGIAIQVFVIKVKLYVPKKEIKFLRNNKT